MAETHIYKGRYTNSSDILYTRDEKHMYSGRYTYSSDIILAFDSPVPVLVMLLSVI